MSDITAQAFREAAGYFARLASDSRRIKDDLGRRTAADFQRHADMLIAAAEHREQLDAAQIEDLAGKLHCLIDWVDQQGLLPDHVFTFQDGDVWERTTQ